MLCRLSRPIVVNHVSKRFGGTFPYFVQRAGAKVNENNQNSHFFKYVGKGIAIAFGLGLGMQFIFGTAEGPYYYDPEKFVPDEYELYSGALGRFLYKYWFTSLRVGHWNAVAGLRFQDEIANKDRIVLDVRRISTQLGAVGMNAGNISHSQSSGSIYDRHAGLHSASPQVLNEMIQYADEHKIMRSRDAIVNKVIMDKGEGAFRNGVLVEFGELGQSMRLPAVGVAPSPHLKPAYYDTDAPTREQ